MVLNSYVLPTHTRMCTFEEDPHESYWEQVSRMESNSTQSQVGDRAAEIKELFLQESGARWEGSGGGPGFVPLATRMET